MTREETTLLMLAFGALVALLIWYKRPVADIPLSDYTEPVTNLTVNQPFMFSPPVANIMPQTASSELGVPLSDTDPYYSSQNCGCY